MSYWDSSALAKLFLHEPDSQVFHSLAASLKPIVTARLACHELLTVFLRKEAEGMIPPGDGNILRQSLERSINLDVFSLLEETPAVRSRYADVLERCFSAVPIIFVRTNDAMHIAAALDAGEIDFVSNDKTQRTAATHLALRVLP